MRVHMWPVSRIPPWAPKFLDALMRDPNVSRAAAIAGYGRQHAYAVRAENAAFRKCWDEAVEIAVDALESEVRRRAMDGVERPIYQGGVFVGSVREHSDQLAALLLKAHRPEKYRENIRHFGIPEAPAAQVAVTVVDGRILSGRLAELAARPSAPGLPVPAEPPPDRFAGQGGSALFGPGQAKEKT